MLAVGMKDMAQALDSGGGHFSQKAVECTVTNHYDISKHRVPSEHKEVCSVQQNTLRHMAYFQFRES